MIVIDTSAVMSASVLGKKTHLDIAKEVAKTVILYTSDKDRVSAMQSLMQMHKNSQLQQYILFIYIIINNLFWIFH